MKIPSDILKRCWFLAGPTACGKSASGLILADTIGAEIVSLDSMALFRGMDIGTAKPSSAERAQVPHHLIDVALPSDDFSVADYFDAACQACEDIVERGRIPLFVGGTGLYLRAILRGVFDGPPADWDLRKSLEQLPPESLWGKLNEQDPVAAEKLHPNDTRRLIRAIEVITTTGKLLSEQQRQDPLPEDERPRNIFWLHPDRDWLYDRINQRVKTMVDDGLVEEVRRLLGAQPPISRTARQGLGYKEMIKHLEKECTLSQATEMIQTRTRQFAKRQHTWFRNLEECRAIDIGRPQSTSEIVSSIMDVADTEAR
ncbi:UNVERIFIED_CONTAM: hypothetical protein GTU68_032161 [Idotea baltica]|nr:hypothetical protein [Idotea baltica]